MTSFGADIDAVHGWNPIFKIQGQIHYRIGSILPENRTQTKFLNVYFLGLVESEMATRQCGGLDSEVIRESTEGLHINNRLIREFKTAKNELMRGGACESTQNCVPRRQASSGTTCPEILCSNKYRICSVNG